MGSVRVAGAEGGRRERRELHDVRAARGHELARRQAAAAQSIRDAELTFLKAQLKARLDAEKRSYDEGTANLRQYYDERRRIIAQEADAEVAALLARKALLSAEDDQVKAKAAKDTDFDGVRGQEWFSQLVQ
jgi:hypothetical protein